MEQSPCELELGRRFTEEVLTSMKSAFIAKDEIIDLLGVCLVAAENLFILGPPGTARAHWSRTSPGGWIGACSIIFSRGSRNPTSCSVPSISAGFATETSLPTPKGCSPRPPSYSSTSC